MNNRYQESWGEAVLLAIAVLWFIAGAAAPAPVLPLLAAPQIGYGPAVVLAILATVIWLGVPYMLYKQAEKIRRRRQDG